MIDQSKRRLIKGGLTLGATAMIIPSSNLMALPEREFFTRGLIRVPLVESSIRTVKSAGSIRRCYEVYIHPSDIRTGPIDNGLSFDPRNVRKAHYLGKHVLPAPGLVSGKSIFYGSDLSIELLPTPTTVIQSRSIQL